MSVVTRCRRTFSSSTTQFSLMPVAASNFGDSFCMMIMSELLTVAMFSVVSATAGLTDSAPTMARAAPAPANKYAFFIIVPPHLGDVLTRRLLRPIPRQSRLPYRLPPRSGQFRARRSLPAGPFSLLSPASRSADAAPKPQPTAHAHADDAKSAPLALLKGGERASTALRRPFAGTFAACPPPSNPLMGNC